MEREFWLDRWNSQQIGFHQADVNPWLRKCWPEMGIPGDSPVFVPLCGKSLDMHWLAQRGHQVYGVELAEMAVRAFFDEAGQPCRIQRLRHVQEFSAGRVSIYCGDFMDLTALHLPGVAAVYDRAALNALPPKSRAHYADHLLRIVPENCRILLLTLEYEQKTVAGPPYSVPQKEVEALFTGRCDIESACRTTAQALPPKFAKAGLDNVTEVIYQLVKRR
ncbi:MAG: thiopurine S-methyltransferase [Gammaproteobacteria bacterium]|nr:thiopurine S-methyltransferase [Gammaproteobacteria bacterium]